MIQLKNKEEIDILKEGGQILAHIMRQLTKIVEPHLNAGLLDKMSGDLAKKYKAIPSFKGYNGFPANLCVSVNNEVVHGFPFDKILKEGDIVGLDFGLKYRGLYTDHAVTVGVGKISKAAKKLIAVTKKTLQAGINEINIDKNVGDISCAIQKYVEKRGYSVVKDLTGHGVGYKVHEPPQIPNFGKSGTGPKLAEGMVLAIEPMVNMGDSRVKLEDDGWTFVTADESLSAHFEHTVVVTKSGYDIITK